MAVRGMWRGALRRARRDRHHSHLVHTSCSTVQKREASNQTPEDLDKDMEQRQQEAAARLGAIRERDLFENRYEHISLEHSGRRPTKIDEDALQSTVFDYVVVGSGHGGSAFALRMAQKGYTVLIIEKGRRYSPSTVPSSTSNWRGMKWLPRLGLFGRRERHDLGCFVHYADVGVGGRSLGSVAHLDGPSDKVFEEGSWAGMVEPGEVREEMAVARRMLGVVTQPFETDCDDVVAKACSDLNLPHPTPASVGVFFGSQVRKHVRGPANEEEHMAEALSARAAYTRNQPTSARKSNRQIAQQEAIGQTGVSGAGRAVWSDPYFDGVGPNRSPCVACGACNVGCEHNAKNVLTSNYLFLAENRYGAEILPLCTATAVHPINADGSDARYVVEAELVEEVPRSAVSPLSFFVSETKFTKPRQLTLQARNVVLAGGTLGTSELLLRMRDDGYQVSDCAGRGVHAIVERQLAVVALDNSDEGQPIQRDMSKGVTVTSYLNHTPSGRVEVSRYANAHLSRFHLLPATEGTTVVARMAGFLRLVAQRPWDVLCYITKGAGVWSTSALRLVEKVSSPTPYTITLAGSGLRATMDINEQQPPTTTPFRDIAEACGNHISTGGAFVLQPAGEMLGKVFTAALTGGANIAPTPEEGVVGADLQVHGMPGLFAVGSCVVSGDLGGTDPTLPSLALAEIAAKRVPALAHRPAQRLDSSPWTTVEMNDAGHRLRDERLHRA